MSAETATAKRVTRTLRASPVKERTPLPREDVENMSAVTLAALGMSSSTAANKQHRDIQQAAATTPQASDRAHKRMSKTSSEMYATPPSTVMPGKSRTVSSSSHVSGINHNNNVHNSSSSRARDRTTTSSSVASSDAANGQHHTHAPLTAIRRPAPQSHQNTTPAGSRSISSSHTNNALSAGRAVSGSMKVSPSSTRLSMNTTSNSAIRSRKTSNNSSIAVSSNTRDTPTSTRSRAPSSDISKHLQREEQEDKEKGVFITKEEYSSLVDLLSAKDVQIESLKEQVDEGHKELIGLKERNNKLQKEKEVLVLEKKEILKNAASSISSNSTGKDGNNSPQAEEGSNISKREYEAFKKQYEMQENLLEGFQRENEKATVELESLKKREKYLTEQLKKIYGPSFSFDNEFNPNTPEPSGPSTRFPSSLLRNGHGLPSSPLNGGMFIGEKQRRRSGFGLLPTLSNPSSLSNGNDDAAMTQDENEVTRNVKEDRKVTTDVEPAILMEQLVNVQSLLERFEKRLLVRESELIKKEREAVEQIEKLQIVISAA